MILRWITLSEFVTFIMAMVAIWIVVWVAG